MSNKDTVIVVFEQEVLDEAYSMGYADYNGLEVQLYDSKEDFEVADDSAIWANFILPELRAMSGFTDYKGGTYNEPNQVVLVEHDPDDRPIMGEKVGCRQVYGRLVNEYRKGAHDAFEEQYDEYNEGEN